MFRVSSYSAFLIAALATGTAFAAQPVGVTIDASTTVTGAGPAGTREIRKDSPIFQDDRLRATKSGNAQIILVDQTRIVVGPGAQVDIDNFVFDTSKTFKSVTIKATKGAFRFVSGNSKSAAYKIATPSGTIGVRGTAFDVAIVGGETHVVMVRGQVEMCSRNGTCQNLRGLCSYGVMDNRGVEMEGSLRQKGRAEKANFPLMTNEKLLQQQFRLGGGCASAASLPVINTPDQNRAAPQLEQQAQPPGRGPAPGPGPGPGPEPERPEPEQPAGNRSGLGDGSNPAFSRSNGKGPTKGAERSGNKGANNPSGGGVL